MGTARVAIITGAAGVLGRAVSERFAAAGLERVPLDLQLGVDLANYDQTLRAVQDAMARYGRIDVLCNIAGGFAMGKAVHESADETWRAMFDINVTCTLNVVRAVLPYMIAAGTGKVVNVAAMAGLAGRPHMAAYSAAKSAVIRITESMSAEVRRSGINVNCVLPSILDTPRNRADMPDADPADWVAPEALAEVIYFLSSDAARAVHGAAIPVTGLV